MKAIPVSCPTLLFINNGFLKSESETETYIGVLSMQATEVENIIKQQIENIEVKVQSDGSHYQVIAIGDVFAGLSPVKKQQLIYGCLNSYILDGTIHAVIIKTYTPEEWASIR